MAYVQMTRIHLLTNLYDYASDHAEVQDAATSILISTSEIVGKFGRVNWCVTDHIESPKLRLG